MKSIFTNIYLFVSVGQTLRLAQVEAASALRTDHYGPWDNKFVESLLVCVVNSLSPYIPRSLLSIHDSAAVLRFNPRFIGFLDRMMNSLREDFNELGLCASDGTRSNRFPDVFTHPITVSEFQGIVSGYKIALSSCPRIPLAASREGIDKIKTMAVVHYVIRGDDKEMYSLFTEEEKLLVDSVMRLLTDIIKSGSLEEPPATGGSSADKPHQYLPGNVELYNFAFGIIGTLITWEDRELIDLYRSVVDCLLIVDVENPSSRWSIYRSLMFVNEQLLLDRNIGVSKDNTPEDIRSRIQTYKRILSRLNQRDHPFVLSFEQLEMIDLYKAFIGSKKYRDSTDFVYSKFLKHTLLLNGILFSLEFESPNSLIVNIVLSVLAKVVEHFPFLDEHDFEVAKGIFGTINTMRSGHDVVDTEWFERVEDGMIRQLDHLTWKTPAEIGYKHLTTEYCSRLKGKTAQWDCETMVEILQGQMGASEFYSVLVRRGIWMPLQKVNKIILHMIQSGDAGTETMVTFLYLVWNDIETKLGNGSPMMDEKRLLEKMMTFKEEIAAQSIEEIEQKLDGYPTGDAFKEYLLEEIGKA